MYGDSDSTNTRDYGFAKKAPLERPGLLVAYAPPLAVKHDRWPLFPTIQIGRTGLSDIYLGNTAVSRDHCHLLSDASKTLVEDKGSRNGTFVDGETVTRTALSDQAVLKVGDVLFVYLEDARPVMASHETDTRGMVGRFHGGVVARQLEESARSQRGLLLAGPSGSGKELAARALGDILGKKLAVQNAARFSSNEEAAASLFGVGSRVFSGVSDRPGYIEQADGGVFFLDEAHNLPRRLQKSLLRVIEDGVLVRIGETRERKVNVRFVLASNKMNRSRGLVKDLFNRLRQVDIPPLAERRADIPEIFNHVLDQAFAAQELDAPPAADMLGTDHYESLMLDGFVDSNVRGLADIADRIATRAATGATPEQAIASVFTTRYAKPHPEIERTTRHKKHIQSMVTTISNHKELQQRLASIDDPTFQDLTPHQKRLTTEALNPYAKLPPHTEELLKSYHDNDANVSAIERDLKSKGVNYSRKRIAKILDELGLPRERRG